MKLEGQVALVTGASQGIGHACALALARQGATVAAAARNQQKLEEVVAEITAAGGKASAFVMDVADEDQVKSGIKSALAQLGKIDILVNNAGITRDQLVMRMKRADWDAVLNTNLTSAYLCIQQVIGSMLKQRDQHLRTNGPGGAGELRGFQSRTDRADDGHGARGGVAQYYVQRGSSGIY